MIVALFAAAAVSAACDLEKPSGQPGCTRAAVDALPMNALQAIGTHNSYKLEIDVVYDPQPGLYANPLGYRSAGAAAVPYDFAPLKQPGLKVIHEPSVDYRSVCPLFTGCLKD